MLAVLCGGGIVHAAGGPVALSEPRIFDTRTTLAQNIGRMRWLDAQSLAITTASRNWWEPSLVVADITSKSVRTLLDAGSVGCVDGRDSVVAVTEGSQARMYTGQASEEEPRFVVYRWDTSSKKLVNPRTSSPRFAEWSRCAQGAESVLDAGMALNVRPLGGRNGELTWPETGRGPVIWTRPGSAPLRLDVAAHEIALIPQPLPFLDGFLLSMGGFKATTRAASIPGVGSVFWKHPMVMLRSDGQVQRVDIPDAAIPVLAAEHGGDGELLPSAVGTLAVMQGQYRQGAALYLIEGDRPRLLWRLTGSLDPRIVDLTLSPDGCSVAFRAAASGIGGPVQVMTFCAR